MFSSISVSRNLSHSFVNAIVECNRNTNAGRLQRVSVSRTVVLATSAQRPFESEKYERKQSEEERRSLYRSSEEINRWREQQRSEGLEQYEKVKQEVTQRTLLISGVGFSYCLLGVSLNAGLSFALGSAGSLAYLYALMADTDSLREGAVPPSLRDTRRRNRKGLVSSLDTVGSLQRVLDGARFALSSRRLLVPAVLMLLLAASHTAAPQEEAALHLQLAPLLVGFLTYKAAILSLYVRVDDVEF